MKIRTTSKSCEICEFIEKMNSSKRCDLDESAHNTTITEKLMVNHGNQERAILGYGKKFRRKDKFI
jgi:hypothetical protein